MSVAAPAGKREADPRILYDVGTSVKTWGRRGIVWGGAAGFALGIACIAIPLTSDVLTFGIGGTLIVTAVVGAFIAGVLGAFAALAYGSGVPRREGADDNQRRMDGRWPANVGGPVALVSSPDWQTPRQSLEPAATQFKSETDDTNRAN